MRATINHESDWPMAAIVGPLTLCQRYVVWNLCNNSA